MVIILFLNPFYFNLLTYLKNTVHGIQFGLDCFIQDDSSVLGYGVLTIGTECGLKSLGFFPVCLCLLLVMMLPLSPVLPFA